MVASCEEAQRTLRVRSMRTTILQTVPFTLALLACSAPPPDMAGFGGCGGQPPSTTGSAPHDGGVPDAPYVVVDSGLCSKGPDSTVCAGNLNEVVHGECFSGQCIMTAWDDGPGTWLHCAPGVTCSNNDLCGWNICTYVAECCHPGCMNAEGACYQWDDDLKACYVPVPCP